MDVAIQARHGLVLQGLAALVGREPDLVVVASVRSAGELIDSLGERPADAAVIDIDTEEWCAFRLTAALRRRWPSIRIVGLVDGVDRDSARRAHQAGLHALVPRATGIDGVVQALRGPRRAMPLPAPLVDVSVPRSGRLTPREREVLEHVAAGHTTREISELLAISPKTVENHKQRIFAKLGVQSQAHAVAVAMRLGVIEVPRVTA